MSEHPTQSQEPFTASRVSLVLSVNDLEAQAIVGFAEAPERGWDVVDLGLNWGVVAPLDLQINGLASTVLLVETPSAALEEQIRASGRRLHVVDHHLTLSPDGRILDRRSPMSSLEQVAALAGEPALSHENQAIAANDRGFYMGLLRHFASCGLALEEAWHQTVALRDKEIAFRCSLHGDMATVEEAEKWFDQALTDSDAPRVRWLEPGTGKAEHAVLLLIHAPFRLAPVLADAIYRHEFERRLARAKDGTGDGKNKGKVVGLDDVLPRALEFLILYEREGASDPHPVALEWSAGPERAELVDDLLGIGRQRTCEGSVIEALSVAAGTSEVSSFFRAEAKPGALPDAIDRLADRILDETLTGARPLRYWRSQFYQVLSWDPDYISPRMTEAAERLLEPCPATAQERAYFFSHLQGYLAPHIAQGEGGHESTDAIPFPKKGLEIGDQNLVLRSWRLKFSQGEEKESAGDTAVSLRLRVYETREGGAPRFDLPIKDVRIHIAFNGLIILEWVFEGAPLQLERNEKDEEQEPGVWWRALLERPAKVAPGEIATVAQLLDFNAIARTCYTPYQSKDGQRIELEAVVEGGGETAHLALGERVQEKPGHPDHWFGLLVKVALGPLGLRPGDLTIRLDERARLVGSAVGAGRGPGLPSGLKREAIVMSRFAGVDAFGENHFYDPDFDRNELASFRYTRFDAFGSKFSATSHSFTLLGYGSFPARELAPVHMATMYRRMFMVILMHGGVFDTLSQAIADRTADRLRLEAQRERGAGGKLSWHEKDEIEEQLDAVTRRVGELRWRLTAYVNALWYEDISPQIQGREIFSLMRQHSPISAAHREVVEELERSDELEQRARAERQADRNVVLEELALAFAIFLGMISVGSLVNPDGRHWLSWLVVGLAAGFVGAAGRRASQRDKTIYTAIPSLLGDVGYWLRKALTPGADGRSKDK